MAEKQTTIYEDAVDLLERINNELKENKNLEALNIKMVGVVTDLNRVRVEKITGKEVNQLKEG